MVLNRKKLFNRIKEFSIFYIKAIQKNRSQKIHDTSKAKEAMFYYQPKSFFLQIKFLTINISIIDIKNDNSAIEKMNKLCEGIMYLNRLIIHSLRWFDKIVSRIQNATPTTPTNQIQLTLSKLPSLSYC